MIKTINLPAATETTVAANRKYLCAYIENQGDVDIYASKNPTIVADADNVMKIKAGETKQLLCESDKVYLLSSAISKSEIYFSDYLNLNFRKKLKGGDLEEFVLNKLTLNDLINTSSGGTWNNNVYTNNGITYTVNLLANGFVKSITVNGTASATSTFVIKRLEYKKLNLNKNYWLMGSAVGTTSTHFLRLALQESVDIWKENKNDIGAGTGFTATYEYYSIYIRVVSGTNVNNVIYTPVLLKDY